MTRKTVSKYAVAPARRKTAAKREKQRRKKAQAPPASVKKLMEAMRYK